MENDIFLYAQSIRKQIISSLPITNNKKLSISVAYFWPTKYCPIGCDHCMFASPKLIDIDKKNILSDNAVAKFIKISKEFNLQSLVVSGGGEPTLEMATISRLIRKANYKYFEVITGAHWTANEDLIHQVLNQFQEAISERKKTDYSFNFKLRISIDTYHQQVVKLDWIKNLIRILQQDSITENKLYPDISLFFRTLLLEDENTAEQLANKLGGKLSRIKNYIRKIAFPGTTFKPLLIFYKDMRFVGKAKEIKDVNKSIGFTQYFKSYSKKEGDIRLGMSYLNPGSKGESLDGMNVFVSYNGKIMPYGGSPDITFNINEDNEFQEYINQLLKDVVSRTLLYKGLRHIQKIAQEVDYNLSNRVKQKNWLASVADESLATSELRLYVTIRLIQQEIKNGELNIKILPNWLQNFVCLSKNNLIEKYKKHLSEFPPQEYIYGNEMVRLDNRSSYII